MYVVVKGSPYHFSFMIVNGKQVASRMVVKESKIKESRSLIMGRESCKRGPESSMNLQTG